MCVLSHSVQEVEQLVKITQTQRSKKKYVTVVTGLRTFGMACMFECSEHIVMQSAYVAWVHTYNMSTFKSELEKPI